MGNNMVLVRLADIPRHVRLKAASRVIRDEHLEGVDALLLKLRAIEPIENPAVLVERGAARRVGVAA